ncbi:tRNA (guanosine(46)-N7)-methyltransferase TrmB [Candidatus Gracilibacteria bacterium]|nr:tRNA (guanosine(46)-N7)-methyltransferase TrmB [Candidatus Gracilibacteria bacterium]
MKNLPDNPYKIKVENHDKIMAFEKDFFEIYKGKWNKYFGNNNPVYLEIGTGMGNFFSKESSRKLDKNFIGIELKYKRLYNTAEKSIELGAKNFILLKTFAQNIDKIFGKEEIDKIYVYFPDPWGKKDRQKKHRLFQEKFIRDLYEKTKIGGKLIFKTDHLEYFDTTISLFKEIGLWKINILSHDYESELENFETKEMTEFEHIFRKDRVKVNYVEFEK